VDLLSKQIPMEFEESKHCWGIVLLGCSQARFVSPKIIYLNMDNSSLHLGHYNGAQSQGT